MFYTTCDEKSLKRLGSKGITSVFVTDHSACLVVWGESGAKSKVELVSVAAEDCSPEHTQGNGRVPNTGTDQSDRQDEQRNVGNDTEMFWLA